MIWYQLDLTTALRPLLAPDESLLFLQDAVGLYEGKHKTQKYQNGQAYLTSHRICYVDRDKPREYALAIELKDIDRYEHQTGFLKSSPKIILYPTQAKHAAADHLRPPEVAGSSSRSGASSPSFGSAGASYGFSALPKPSRTGGTWICPICSFSNPVPSNFDPTFVSENTPVPPCLSCGVVPPLKDVLKAAISHASRGEQSSLSMQSDRATLDQTSPNILPRRPTAWGPQDGEISEPFSEPKVRCPRCTFLNHPSLKTCELCDAALPSPDQGDGERGIGHDIRSDSPGPFMVEGRPNARDGLESIKLSFRAGGDKAFYERLKGAMVQRKWLLHGAPPVPKPDPQARGASSPGSPRGWTSGRNSPYERQERARTLGLAGLQQRDLQTRKNNEIVIGTAFEDLEALMASAKEVVALAERFSGAMAASPTTTGSTEASALVSHSATALGLMTTKDVLGTGSTSDSLYLSELSRNLAEFLTDDATGVLRREGGVMTLVDLWAVFNRARGGVELVSPLDFHKAASLWEKLNLPVRLRSFRSGVLVVQGKDRTDEKTIASLLAWLGTLHDIPPDEIWPWDVRRFGRGVTPQEVAERFGWSVGVASEELQLAEERGVLCREESVEGVRFWENWLTETGVSG